MGEKLTGDFRKFMDKNFLGVWDVPEGQDLVLTIDRVDLEKVKNDKGTKIKLTLHFKEDVKPMVCNITNGKSISMVAGSSDVENWPGKKIAIYVAHDVPAFGGTTDALRVRQKAPELTCAVCGKAITDVMVDGKLLKAAVIANRAKTNYGKMMCFDCATAAKAEQEGAV